MSRLLRVLLLLTFACVCSALEIYEQTGRTRTDHLKQQHSVTGSSAVSGRLRFSEICMIWVQCSQRGVKCVIFLADRTATQYDQLLA